MPDQIKNQGFFQFPGGELSPGELREKLLQGKGEANLLGAMTEALDLYAFMSSLPNVLVASQKREAERLEKLSGEKGPRVEALKASMAHTEKLNAMFASGKARVDRAMASVAEVDDVFHGFVSTADLRMQQGYTVRVVGAEGKPLHSAVTQSDGYFTMTLKTNPKEKSGLFGARDGAQTALLGEMLQLFGMRGSTAPAEVKAAAGPRIKEAMAKDEPQQPKEPANVEILDANGQVVLQDPIPVDLNAGTIYREYVVGARPGESAAKRYVGNSAKLELHDTQKVTKQCNFDAIRASHKVYFNSAAEAEKAGYDYCAYCFGKQASKR